jgi:hypothetical protein
VNRETWDKPTQALGLFLRGRTLRTALPTAFVVGTILCAVNQGSTLIAGDATTDTWLRMAFNYATPFVVASVGYLAARRGPHRNRTTPTSNSKPPRGRC